MLQGIEIMLERMKTHPEEFIVQNKYTEAFHRALPHLTAEEVNMVKTALTEAHRAYFTGEVMSIMAGEATHSQQTMRNFAPPLSEYVMQQSQTLTTTIGSTSGLISASTGTYAPSAFGLVPVSSEGTK